MTTSEMLTLLNNMLIAPHTTTVTAYRTGLKEMRETVDKYRWHDLRKDPNDLPEDNKRIMFFTIEFPKYRYFDYYDESEQRYWTGEYWERTKEFVNDDYEEYVTQGIYPLDEVIAWREIEPFEGSEE